jgi:hypothetical protein
VVTKVIEIDPETLACIGKKTLELEMNLRRLAETEADRNAWMERHQQIFDLLQKIASGLIKPDQLWIDRKEHTFMVMPITSLPSLQSALKSPVDMIDRNGVQEKITAVP